MDAMLRPRKSARPTLGPNGTERPALRLGVAVSEVAANAASSRWLLLSRILAGILVGFGVAFATVVDTSAIVTRFHTEVDLGRFVYKVSGGGPEGSLSAERCDALAYVTGITAAGGVTSASTIIARAQPRARYELLSVTAGYSDVLWPGEDTGTSTGGLLAGAGIARTLGLVAGSTLSIADESDPTRTTRTVTIDRVMPTSPRDSAADRRLFRVGVGAGRTEECLVDAVPAHAADVPLLVGAWFPASAAPVSAPLRLSDPARLTPEDALVQRPSAWAWPVGAGVLAAMALLSWYFRRADFALYRVLGVSRQKIAVMLSAEHVALTVAPAQVGFLAAVLLRNDSVAGITARLLLLDDARMVVALLLLPALALALFRTKSTVDVLKGY